MKNKVFIIYILLSVFVIIYLVWLNYTKKPQIIERTVTQYVEVEKPRYIEKIKKIEVPVEKIITLEKEKIIEKENLPEWLKGATEQVVLTIGDVKPYTGKTRVISILNTKTGEGSLIQKQLPLTLLEFKRDLRLSAVWDFFNQKPLLGFEFTFLRFSKLNFKIEGGVINKLYGGVGVWVEF